MGVSTGVRPCLFFHRVLGSDNPDTIREYLGRLKTESEQITRTVTLLVLNFEGGITYSEGWAMSPAQRDEAVKQLLERSDKIKASQGVSLQKEL